ncbi:MAG TPA: hypothetical protein VED40_00550 [Azospirillaceae bacterium]|nr:hypothetical protein [Azospirillaceae bacterium]
MAEPMTSADTDGPDILDLDGLRRDMLLKAGEMRAEAERIRASSPADSDNLHRIAARLEVYVRDYLKA